MQTLLEEVNTPNHYRTHESGLEAIEITRYLIGDLSNAWKYAMRYEDKNTPKKDVLKLCWYLTDFKNNFIDENNECTANIDVPVFVKERMLKVIDTEPVVEIRNAFNQIYTTVSAGGLLFPKAYDKTISDLKVYAETLK
ncbi:MAG: DUF3310 domain-containing protein [Methanobrevibacter sp.]|nr:DUF3310 domain-containing protein [Methanobrevibacter sp.]